MEIVQGLLLPQNLKENDKPKIVVILGATGTGKSRLSIGLGNRFSPCEIINSDKMQVYKGLDITTNKIPINERHGIPHHLIDEFDSVDGELLPSHFRSLTASIVAEISSKTSLPLLVGGSVSLIHAFLTNKFDSAMDGSSLFDIESVSSELRYDCCFIWVDVYFPVLKEYLARRVDEMLEAGMLEEIAKFYESEGLINVDSVPPIGIKKSIGIPEFERYFKIFPPRREHSRFGSEDHNGGGGGRQRVVMVGDERFEEEVARRILFEEAVQAIKENTYQLAKRQVEKIQRLISSGWNIQKLNATEVFRTLLMESNPNKSLDVWDREIMEPSMKIVQHFLEK